MAEKTVYLPKVHTRIGKAGYKGKNVKVYDPRDGSPAANPKKVVAVTPTKTASTKAAPKKGLKPLKPKSSSK